MTQKITFSNLKKENPLKIKVIKINDKDIEVKQYLPVNDKLQLITSVLQQIAQNEYPFPNPVQLDVYTVLEIIYAYIPGIEFTDEEKADPASLYDALEEQGIPNKVMEAIPRTEYEFLMTGIEDTITAYYNYRNSARGIMEDITTDYSNLNFDAEEIRKKLGDPENVGFLKEVMKKMG